MTPEACAALKDGIAAAAPQPTPPPGDAASDLMDKLLATAIPLAVTAGALGLAYTFLEKKIKAPSTA